MKWVSRHNDRNVRLSATPSFIAIAVNHVILFSSSRERSSSSIFQHDAHFMLGNSQNHYFAGDCGSQWCQSVTCCWMFSREAFTLSQEERCRVLTESENLFDKDTEFWGGIVKCGELWNSFLGREGMKVSSFIRLNSDHYEIQIISKLISFKCKIKMNWHKTHTEEWRWFEPLWKRVRFAHVKPWS